MGSCAEIGKLTLAGTMDVVVNDVLPLAASTGAMALSVKHLTDTKSAVFVGSEVVRTLAPSVMQYFGDKKGTNEPKATDKETAGLHDAEAENVLSKLKNLVKRIKSDAFEVEEAPSSISLKPSELQTHRF